MILIEDSKQKKEHHVIKNEAWSQSGITVMRCNMLVGDYCIPPSVVVDTKKNMQEIANNIGSDDHVRFKNSCMLAQKMGTQLYVLVENEEGIVDVSQVHKWINPDCIYRPKAIQGERLQKAMMTMQERYGVIFRFCHPNDSADIILKILTGG